MKKIVAALLCAAVCLTTGCSNSETSSTGSTPNPSYGDAAGFLFGSSKTSSKSTSTSKPTSTSSKSSTSSSSKSSSSKTSEPTSVPVTTSDYRRGKWNGKTYVSDFFGFSVTVDSDWNTETDAQLISRNKITDMNDATISAALDSGKSPYELFATKTGGYSMAIGINKVKGVTASQYVKANVDQMKAMSSTFKDVRSEKITVSGKEQDCIYATYASGVADVYEALVLYNNGDYYALVTIGAMSSENLQATINAALGGASSGNASTPSGNTSTPTVNDGSYKPGRWNGNTFTSEFFGYSFTVDSSWTIGTDEEVAGLNSIADMSDASMKAAVDKSNRDSMVTEAFLMDENFNTIMVATNKDTAKTTDEYAQTQVNGMKLMSEYKDVRVEKSNISGKSQTCIYATISESGSEVYEMFVIYQNGNYFSVVMVGVTSKNELQSTVNSIFA